MIQNEAIYRLRQLPKDTVLTTEHVIGIVDWVLKAGGQDGEGSEKPKPAPLLTEQDLSDWLGESTSTIQKWRVSGTGPKFVKKPKGVGYRVKDVEDWLDARSVSSTTEATVKGLAFSSSIVVPVFFHTIAGREQALSLAESLATEDAPDRFEIFEVRAMSSNWDEHSSIMEKLAIDNTEAQELMGTASLKDFNIGFWLYSYCLRSAVKLEKPEKVIEAVELLLERGACINEPFLCRGDSYTIAHLMADCHGSMFLCSFTRAQQSYDRVLSAFLDLGLDATLPNSGGVTPLTIAEQVEQEFGLGTSMFKRVYRSWKLKHDLESSLTSKPAGQSPKKDF